MAALKTLHLYLTRQVLATLILTVVVCTFVLLLGNVLKEILALLVNRQATLGLVARAILLLIPFVMVFALPMGMLTATLLVFGRFSADQELTAVRANGISLLALVSPILLLSVALAALCGWFNLKVAPECRTAYKGLLVQQGLQNPVSLLAEGRFITELPGYLIYVGRKKGNQLEDILLSVTDQGQVNCRIRAQGGQYWVDTVNHQLILQLTNVVGITNRGQWDPFMMQEFPVTNDLRKVGISRGKPGYSDMTFSQLWEEKKALEQRPYVNPPPPQSSQESLRHDLQMLSQMGNDALMPVTVQIHRQVAFSFACIGFTLVGIPLGIRAHRRETSVGIAMAIVLVLVYYSFIVLAQSFQTRSDLSPHLLLWVPNFLFQAVGAVLLWRANRTG